MSQDLNRLKMRAKRFCVHNCLQCSGRIPHHHWDTTLFSWIIITNLVRCLSECKVLCLHLESCSPPHPCFKQSSVTTVTCGMTSIMYMNIPSVCVCVCVCARACPHVCFRERERASMHTRMRAGVRVRICNLKLLDSQFSVRFCDICH